MDSRSRFLVQILEKLGAPILSAVGDVCRREPSGTDANEAERVAGLLTKSVQTGIALAGIMDVKGADAGGDSLRLALTALSAPLLSDMYAASGKMPSDADIRRLVTALQASLTFADNFAPSAENAGRLEAMTPNSGVLDASQIEIQFIHAMVPALNAINAFSFGVPEKKLAQDVSDRLTQGVAALRKALLGGALAQAEEKQAEIGLLGSLAQLYAAAHRAETAKLMAMSEADRAKAAQTPNGLPSMETVWHSFEKAEGMLEALGRFAAPAGSQKGSGAQAVAPSPPPVVPVQPAAPIPPAAAAPQAPPASPMGFFKPGVKKEDSQQTGTQS